MRVILLGGPGSGKGTQAEILARDLGVPAISVGQLLRDEVKKGSEIGLKAEPYMKEGKWVPYEITFALLKERLEKPDAQDGFVIDAFPRLGAEYHQLGSYLIERGWKLDAVISLEVSDFECLRRIGERSKIQASKGVYRPDTAENVTLERLALHRKTSAPILAYYEESGLLHRVNGELPAGMISKEIKKILKVDE